MVQKKKAAKKRKKVAKREGIALTEGVSSTVKEKENRQLLWFFFWILLVFAIVLGTYFFIEGQKRFTYEGLDWNVESYEGLEVYHARFPVLSGENVTFNTYLRNDPRTNKVRTQGNFSSFKYGAYLSFSPEVNLCRGGFSRAVVDVGSFLKAGVGVGSLEAGTTDPEVAHELEEEYVTCSTHPQRTVVVFEMGDSAVVQSSDNPFCYTIYIKDCSDILPLEKFIVKTVSDFRETYS